MEKAASISGKKPDNPGLDFAHLRAYGIKAIQELTGAFWTDYNEHDPGVTILEQLCYALTDLCYRTEFDIEDHLYNQHDDDTFLKAHQILPCNALTVNDYRKLIFDSVFELKNVWVSPIDKDGSSFTGLYKILIDVDENINSEEARKAVLEKTKRVFCNNRTVCEDLEEIKILNHLDVEIFAEVEVDGVRDTENILAEVYFAVDEYLSPEIRFYSLQELLQEGYSLNEIFNGPLLKHGFIKSSELQPKPRQILISEVIKIIMQVKGVVSVKNLYLQIGDKKFENQVDIGEDELPKLVTTLKNGPKSAPGVHFFRGTVNYSSLDFNVVKRQLNELKSGNKRVYRLSEETIKIPLGKKVNVEEYFSIQNQFPVVYGIGEYGLSEREGLERKAQARQLKGFLLIFEQILANYLSQLSNAKTLFSLKEDVRQTYFYQFLDAVPDVKPLLKEKGFEFFRDAPNESTSLSYYGGLPQLVREKDNYTDRRNRFLDYLLAIHGESYTQYSLSQFNYYFNDEEFDRHLILNKTRLLKSLSSINKNRARAFNYLEPSLGTENITGMEAKISILLGLGVQHSEEVSNYKAHSLLNHYEEEGLKLLSENATEEDLKPWVEEGRLPGELNEELIENEFDYIDSDDVDFALVSDEEKSSLLQQTLPYKSGILTSDFLRESIEILNFRIGPIRRKGRVVADDAIQDEDSYEGEHKTGPGIGEPEDPDSRNVRDEEAGEEIAEGEKSISDLNENYLTPEKNAEIEPYKEGEVAPDSSFEDSSGHGLPEETDPINEFSSEKVSEGDGEQEMPEINDSKEESGNSKDNDDENLADNEENREHKVEAESDFSEGIVKQEEQIQLSPVADESEEVSYGLVYKGEDQKEWLFIGEFDSEPDAIKASLALIEKVKSLNISSEGLHILEHILLRPDLHDTNHGILIYNQERKPFLRSESQFSFEERGKVLEEIRMHLYEFANYSVEATRDKDFEVHFSTPDGKYKFVSMKANESVDETHEQMEKLYNYVADKNFLTPYSKKVGLYVKNLHSGKIIPEDFFSYRLSILLPDWTARFNNKEFRSIIEDTIHEQKPANVALNCYWLNSVQLADFEKVYYQWMEEKRKPEIDKVLLNDLNNQLSDMLVTFKEACEV